jgi:molybdopterin molybdotransferase
MPDRILAHIAARLPGFDPDNLRTDHVNQFLAQLVAPVQDTEELGIFDALGRVLAGDLISPISVPPHNNSAMDGFAFDGQALRAGQSLQLRIAGAVLAGDIWQGRAGPGEALRITTGAMLPTGLDTVIPHELAQCTGDQLTVPADLLRPGDNCRLLGEDLMQGRPALPGGERLGPAALGLIASLGIPRVTVRRRLRVAYFSTGNEILSLGDPLRSRRGIRQQPLHRVRPAQPPGRRGRGSRCGA